PAGGGGFRNDNPRVPRRPRSGRAHRGAGAIHGREERQLVAPAGGNTASVAVAASHQASASAETSRGNFEAECRFRIAGHARVTTFAPTPYKGAGQCSP